MNWREERRRPQRNSDAWMFPGMDRSRGGDDWYGRFYQNGENYRGDQSYQREERDRRDGFYDDRGLVDRDYYGQPSGDRHYEPDRGYDEHRDRWTDHPRSHDGFLHRAGERLRELWDDWRGDDRRHGQEGYFGRPFNEDRNEHRYGRDNWAPNSNRGYRGERHQRRRQPERSYHPYH